MTPLVGLVAVAAFAFVLSRSKGGPGGPGAGGGVAGGAAPADVLSAVPAGKFEPQNASRMPDFEYVTKGYDDSPSSYDKYLWGENFYSPEWRDFVRLNLNSNDSGPYFVQMWRPASRISLDSLVKGDFERAAQFLVGSWRKGVSAGCPPSDYDERYGHINQMLEDEASGLDIGSSIGIGIVSAIVPAYSQGAAASDSGFGFGRGASEDRQAIVDVDNLQGASADVGIVNAFGPPRKNPANKVEGQEQVIVNGASVIGCYPNLFWPLFRKYDAGFASKSVDSRNFTTSPTGTDYVRVGYAYPWCAREMGCDLSLKERVYIRARMYRALDLLACTLFPREAESVQAGNVGFFVEGKTEAETRAIPVRYVVSSSRFGVIKGSIFPSADGNVRDDGTAKPPLGVFSGLAAPKGPAEVATSAGASTFAPSIPQPPAPPAAPPQSSAGFVPSIAQETARSALSPSLVDRFTKRRR